MSTPMLRSGPPFAQSDPSPAYDELAAGELWTTSMGKEDWPVVICDEAIVMMFFKDRVRPFNARKADGTWPADYKSGSTRVIHRSYPTIMLGQLRFTWIVREKLHLFETDLGEAFTLSTKIPLHAQAWREAIRLYGLRDPLPDLKQAILQQRSEKGHPKASTGCDNILNIKRKGTPMCKNSYSMDETDDEEPKAGGFQQRSSTSNNIKKEPRESSSFNDMNAGEGSTDLRELNLEQPEKKSRLNEMNSSSVMPSAPPRAGSQSLMSFHKSKHPDTPSLLNGMDSFSMMPFTTSRAGSQSLMSFHKSKHPDTPSELQALIDDPNKVSIYVGNPQVLFFVTRRNLAASPLLTKWIGDHPKLGTYIMSPILSHLTNADFLPVGQYIERGEYDPNLLDEGTEWARLVTEESGPGAAHEVIRCATIYDTAFMLELYGLQDLAFRKLKALANKVPHQSSAILCAADIVFKIAQPNMKQYLVQYLAKHFWSLVEEESRDLAQLMQGNDELRKKVCGLLAGPPEPEIKPKVEEKMKNEDKKDTSLYHATVAAATNEDSSKEDEFVIIPAEEQATMRRTAQEILTADDIDECNALDDDAAGYAIAATLPYPIPAQLPAEIEGQLQQGLGENYEGVVEVLDDIREDDEYVKILDDIREEDRQLSKEEETRLMEG